MCQNLFSKEMPCGLILVSNHIPYEITKSLHFGWSLTGGSTALINLLCLIFIFQWPIRHAIVEDWDLMVCWFCFSRHCVMSIYVIWHFCLTIDFSCH